MSASSILKGYFSKVIDEINKKKDLILASSDKQVLDSYSNILKEYFTDAKDLSNKNTEIISDSTSRGVLEDIVKNKDELLQSVLDGFELYYNYYAKDISSSKEDIDENIGDKQVQISKMKGSSTELTFLDGDEYKNTLAGYIKEELEETEKYNSIKSELDILNSEESSLEEDLKSIESDLYNLKLYEDSVDSTNLEIKKLEEKKLKLEETIEEYNKEIEDYNTKITNETVNIVTYNSRLASLSDTEENADEIATLKLNIDISNKNITNYNKKIEKLNTKISNVQDDIEDYETQISNNKDELKIYNTEVSRLKNLNLEEKQASKQEEITNKKSEIESKQTELDEQAEIVTNICTEEAELQTRIEKIEEEIEELQTQLTNYNEIEENFSSQKDSKIASIKNSLLNYCKNLKSFATTNVVDTDPDRDGGLTRYEMAETLNWVDNALDIDLKLKDTFGENNLPNVSNSKLSYTLLYEENNSKIGNISNLEIYTELNEVVFKHDNKDSNLKFYIKYDEDLTLNNDCTITAKGYNTTDTVDISLIDLISIYYLLDTCGNRVDGVNDNIDKLKEVLEGMRTNLTRIQDLFKRIKNGEYIDDPYFVETTNFCEWWNNNYEEIIFKNFIDNDLKDLKDYKMNEDNTSLKSEFAEFVKEFVNDLINGSNIVDEIEISIPEKLSGVNTSSANTVEICEGIEAEDDGTNININIYKDSGFLKNLRDDDGNFYTVNVNEVARSILKKLGFSVGGDFGNIDCESFYKDLFDTAALNSITPSGVLVDNNTNKNTSIYSFIANNQAENADESGFDTAINTFINELRTEAASWTIE